MTDDENITATLNHADGEIQSILRGGAVHGALHALALKADGTVTAWGVGTNYNPALYAYGQCIVPPGLTNVAAIAAGGFHSLALIGDDPPATQVPLTCSGWSNNVVPFSLPTQCNRVYSLEYRNSLGDANWIALPLVAGNGGTLILTDPDASSGQRFYRVRQW